MRYHEKLYKRMHDKGLNQQKLAKLSNVSDSEVSRILGGKSQPGLENAFRLARAVGVSLDYLADEQLEEDPLQEAGPASAAERDILEVARELGYHEAYRVLDIARVLGPELAISRLVCAQKPVIEVGDGQRSSAAPSTAAPVSQAPAMPTPHANSA